MNELDGMWSDCLPTQIVPPIVLLPANETIQEALTSGLAGTNYVERQVQNNFRPAI